MKKTHERSLTTSMMIPTIIQLISLRNYYVIRDHRKGHDAIEGVIAGSTKTPETKSQSKSRSSRLHINFQRRQRTLLRKKEGGEMILFRIPRVRNF